jgi:cysteine synthase A
MTVPAVVSSPLSAIGNTPLVQLRRLVPPDSANVYVKLEYYNPTGSYKDRMAAAMVQEAEQRGDLRPGMRVVEYTGGSTGSSLAFVCAVKGYPFYVVSSDAFAQEKLDTMRAFGAQLEVIPSEGKGITEQLLKSMIRRATELAQDEDTYFTDQFNNRDAIKGYQVLGQEIVEQLPERVDLFCAGVGTAGMLVGTARALRESFEGTRVVALEPASSPVLSKGQKGSHHVEGIGVGFVPPLLQTFSPDEVRAIDEAEARETARRLAREEGIFSGVSSGLNVAAALQLARELGPGHSIVTVACDTGLKYLHGDLYKR